jgi:ribosomal protein L7/L12
MTTPYRLSQDVLEAISRGEKIMAIKLLREQTGLGLKEAKDLVEWHMARAVQSVTSTPARVPYSGGLPAGVQEALAAGNKIEAIKRFREQTGVGLKEAKDAVERLEQVGQQVIAASGMTQPARTPPLSPATMPSSEVTHSKTALWLALVAVLIIAVGVYLLVR